MDITILQPLTVSYIINDIMYYKLFILYKAVRENIFYTFDLSLHYESVRGLIKFIVDNIEVIELNT